MTASVNDTAQRTQTTQGALQGIKVIDRDGIEAVVGRLRAAGQKL